MTEDRFFAEPPRGEILPSMRPRGVEPARGEAAPDVLDVMAGAVGVAAEAADCVATLTS